MKKKYRLKSLFFFSSVLFFFSGSLQAEIFGHRLIFDQLVFAIRDPQTKAGDFRGSLEKIGEYLALEVLQELPTEGKTVQTLTGAKADHHLVKEKPVLFTILRAGLPLLMGIQKIFPDSEVGFFAISRNEETLQPTTSYVAMPDVTGKVVVIADTMLATGGSFLDAIKIIKKQSPKKIILVSAIAAKGGMDRILAYDADIRILAAAIDPTLNEKGYIVPGLGDAGDRCYGYKH
jgi:uracil phosphoribosyltransferase